MQIIKGIAIAAVLIIAGLLALIVAAYLAFRIAAAIFEQMTNNLDLAARILKVMSAEDRGKILGAMNSEVAAKITKIMDPES